MTEIAFHFNVPDKLTYACRLLRKGFDGGARLTVVCGEEMQELLDRALWRTAPHEFVAHCRVGAPDFVLRATPVVLAGEPAASPHREVLVNLSDELPAGFGGFQRLIEVVCRGDEADRQRARIRWKHYAERGYPIERHDLAASEG